MRNNGASIGHGGDGFHHRQETPICMDENRIGAARSVIDLVHPPPLLFLHDLKYPVPRCPYPPIGGLSGRLPNGLRIFPPRLRHHLPHVQDLDDLVPFASVDERDRPEAACALRPQGDVNRGIYDSRQGEHLPTVRLSTVFSSKDISGSRRITGTSPITGDAPWVRNLPLWPR